MDDATPPEGLRDRLGRSSEDALGRLAQDLLENPLVNGAIARAFEAREKAAQAQEVAMGALNIPSAADIERLTRRVRSVSQRLEGIEDGVDRLDDRLAGLAAVGGLDRRLDAIEEQLGQIAERLEALGKAPGRRPARASARRTGGREAARRRAGARRAGGLSRRGRSPARSASRTGGGVSAAAHDHEREGADARAAIAQRRRPAAARRTPRGRTRSSTGSPPPR